MNSTPPDADAVTRYITETFADVETDENWGYQFFFYKDDHQVPFASLAASDNEYDRVSQLDRPGVYRLNFAVSRATFQALFGAEKPDRRAYDFAALDVLMPHPEYAAQQFVCVLNPSAATFERVQPLLAEAYALAAQRYARRRPEA
jgi:hypothetical protein